MITLNDFNCIVNVIMTIRSCNSLKFQRLIESLIFSTPLFLEWEKIINPWILRTPTWKSLCLFSLLFNYKSYLNKKKILFQLWKENQIQFVDSFSKMKQWILCLNWFKKHFTFFFYLIEAKKIYLTQIPSRISDVIMYLRHSVQCKKGTYEGCCFSITRHGD